MRKKQLQAKDLTIYSGPEDNSPAMIVIDPAKGYVPGNVAIVSRAACKHLESLSVEERRLAVQPAILVDASFSDCIR
jgi:hypothetical protein